MATLRPYLRQLAQWVCTGWLPPSFAQLPVRAATPPPKKQDSEAYWSDSFTQRAPEAIPAALRPLAAQLTLAGKTREFLGRLPPSGLVDANATTGGVAGGAPGAASLEAAFYLRMLEAVRAAADGAKVPRTRAEEAAAHIRGPTPTASRGAVAVGAATWTPGHPLLPRARHCGAVSGGGGGGGGVGAGETEDGHGRRRCDRPQAHFKHRRRSRGADEHFAAAASSSCVVAVGRRVQRRRPGQGSAGAPARARRRRRCAELYGSRRPPSQPAGLLKAAAGRTHRLELSSRWGGLQPTAAAMSAVASAVAAALAAAASDAPRVPLRRCEPSAPRPSLSFSLPSPPWRAPSRPRRCSSASSCSASRR